MKKSFKQLAKRLTAAALSAVLTVSAFAAVPQKDNTASALPLVNSYVHKSTINVEKVEGISDDFICGMDITSYLSEKASGVKYYDYYGNELDDEEYFEFLADCGVNWVRLRIWNDPFDADGHTYGGGESTLENACAIGKLASDAGMKVLVNFHYSDFWADPAKQKAPKAWANYSVSEKAAAINKYTADSLEIIEKAGVNIGMVQIGNETTGAFCGASDWESICTMFNSGCSAVRDFDEDIPIAIHFTRINNSRFMSWVAALNTYNVDYDVLATSYYPYWHGSIANLTSVLNQVATTYGKDVMVAEVAYTYTAADGDAQGNNSNTPYEGYEISVQGQTNLLRDVCNAVASVSDNKGLGVFYWEPAWIPVTYYDGTTAAWNELSEAWTTYGSGWATSYAKGYDSDASKTGGSTVDNSSLFDFWGYPLDSLETYKFLKDGHTATEDVVIKNVALTTMTGCQKAVNMPETVTATLSNGTKVELEANWNADEVAEAATANKYSRRTVHGTVSYEESVHNCVAILQYWGEPGYGDDELDGIYWEGQVEYETSVGFSSVTTSSSSGLTLNDDTWTLTMSFDTAAASAIENMVEPTLEIKRSGGNAEIWGFGICNAESWEWLVGGETNQTTDTTYTLAMDKALSYRINDRDWSENTLTVRIYDAAATSSYDTVRISGTDRFETSIESANKLKEILGVSKFENIVVASGTGFADALSGSYLATVKNAPVLLVADGNKGAYMSRVTTYIKENLAEDGTIYVLGGTGAVSENFDAAMGSEYEDQIVRFAGLNRYETNLMILEAAGVSAEDDILVSTGTGFADSLSASATGRPILLVPNTLLDSQVDFLVEHDASSFYILGGTGAVNVIVEGALDEIGNVERLSGNNRFETSAMVAETFFEAPDSVVLAYAAGFPDGLSAGPLAALTGSPLLLTQNAAGAIPAPKAYVENIEGLATAYVMGGTALISDITVSKICG